MTLFLDPASNFHPYECDGPGKCVHCDRVQSETHDPATCMLCQYDGAPEHDEESKP